MGLAISAVVHAAVVWWNPVVHRHSSPIHSRPDRQASSWRDAALHAVVAATPPTGSVSATPARTEQDAPARDPAAAAAAEDRPAPDSPAPRAAERLRYRPGAIWAPMDTVYESFEECRQREYAARLDSLITASAAEPAPAQHDAAQRGASGGIRIPFGRRRPPPAQVVPAPLPDSLRPADQRAAPARRVVRRPAGCADTVLPLTPAPRPPRQR